MHQCLESFFPSTNVDILETFCGDIRMYKNRDGSMKEHQVMNCVERQARPHTFSLPITTFKSKTLFTINSSDPRVQCQALCRYVLRFWAGLSDCSYFRCLMNSNSTNSPLILCPVCLRKLHFVSSFDPIERYVKLQNFYRKSPLFTGEQVWMEERLQSLGYDCPKDLMKHQLKTLKKKIAIQIGNKILH